MKTRKVEQKGDQKKNYNTKKNREVTKKHKVKSKHKIRRVKLSQERNIFHRLAKIFCVMAGLCCLLALPAMAQAPEKNGYIADKPLETYVHDTVKGDLYYSVGGSYYSGKVYPGDVYSVTHNVDLPEGATVKFARLYNYWTWSAEGVTGRYPEMKLSFNGNELTPEKEYSDRKGWGIYDYPTGTWAYNVTDLVSGSGTYSTEVENIGPDASFVCIDGVGLLIVYMDSNGKDIEYWINEGADELNSQIDESGNPLYYATSNETICEMLKPTLQLPVRSATLWTIAQSGNWNDNTLLVNDQKFPGITNGEPYPDLDTDMRDITGYLKSGENSILFQAIGDYVVPSGAFLVIEKDPQAKETAQASEETSGKSEETGKTQENSGTEASKTPGFGFEYALALLIGGKLVAGHRQKKG
ncbi:Cell surface glycoprotein [Methanosarcina barkeri str. Wiesmoor]|uniref:Cell surface glycoprotein n=2 Tax=Methanosarcina barkeri TaxID=2208 RepID=A0A0E3LL06_METBA|nr:DUF3344 domain-containing protein [Methanosarcina barkeri]AKB50436.1 Cell surface glycoprotein [Methanosarcina barkeri str. Wiesmoor]